MSTSIFVTGTDTDSGKTLVSAALLLAAQRAGKTTLGLKPVAAGCERRSADGEWVNRDALLLQQYSTVELAYQQVNPVALQAAVAPHIAAQKEGRRLQAERIAGVCRGALMAVADLRLLEGAGGWRVPLNPRETMADLARLLNLPVLLVVGVRLGCINHALLTAEAIRRDGLNLIGWVANQTDPHVAALEENLGTLEAAIPAPCLGKIPYLSSPSAEAAWEYLDISVLV